jgi:phospholipid/cholesterol/gamma-HCH transport system ATP-binding protein
MSDAPVVSAAPVAPAPAGAEPAISVQDLTMGWDDFILQKNASFDVAEGEVFAILGGSGCGKSTLLRYLIGLEKPMEGHIHIRGLGSPDLAVGRPPFGVMFQSGALFGSMTVGENVGLGLRQWTDLPEDAVEAVVSGKLALVGLQGTEDLLPAELSGGMKKRAAIARALALEPRLIFLDEPSAGLDPVSSAGLDELILTLNRVHGMTLVIVTHELQSIYSVVGQCIYLDKESQSIIARGAPRDLQEHSPHEKVRDFFNRRAR